MPGSTDYSTGYGSNLIYRQQQASSGGMVEVYSSGTKALFGEGAKLEMEPGSSLDIASGSVRLGTNKIELKSGAELEMEAASTMNVEAAASVNIYGKLTAKSGGEIELEAGSTLNVEAGAAINFAAGAIERAVVVTYTCSTMKLNTYDRYSIVRSSDPHSNGTSDNCWTLPHPQDAQKGVIKTIWFESPKGDTHTLAIRTTSVKIGFNSTNKHCIFAAATNPFMVTTGGQPGISVTMIAASSSIWRIVSQMSTDVKVGKLQLTSSTECTL